MNPRIRPAATATGGNRRGLVLGGLLVLTIAAAAMVFWPRNLDHVDAPPPLSLEQLAAVSDEQLMSVVSSEVRWAIAGNLDRQEHWRELNPAARTVLALSWVESGFAEQWKSAFRGFASHLSLVSPCRPSLEDLALAYETIGAAEVATVCRDTQRLELQDPPPPATAFTEPDRAFRKACAKDGSLAKLRNYIRAHLADIVATRQAKP